MQQRNPKNPVPTNSFGGRHIMFLICITFCVMTGFTSLFQYTLTYKPVCCRFIWYFGLPWCAMQMARTASAQRAQSQTPPPSHGTAPPPHGLPSAVNLPRPNTPKAPAPTSGPEAAGECSECCLIDQQALVVLLLALTHQLPLAGFGCIVIADLHTSF